MSTKLFHDPLCGPTDIRLVLYNLSRRLLFMNRIGITEFEMLQTCFCTKDYLRRIVDDTSYRDTALRNSIYSDKLLELLISTHDAWHTYTAGERRFYSRKSLMSKEERCALMASLVREVFGFYIETSIITDLVRSQYLDVALERSLQTYLN